MPPAPAPAPNRSRWARIRRRLRRGDRGATLVEFALVSVPFFILLFGIFEIGLIYAANINLSNAVLTIARKVRVGSVVLPGSAVTSSNGAQLALADFKTAVCNDVMLMLPSTCVAQLQVDVRVLSDFATSPPNPINGNTFSTANFCYYSGNPGNIVSIRAYLLWPVATPALLPSLTNVSTVNNGGNISSGSFFVLAADQAFVNEPNSKSTNTGNGC